MAKPTDYGQGCESCEEDHALFKEIEKVKFVDISYDPNNNSLDIFLKRNWLQWNNGVGLQLNELSEEERQALKLYLEKGK